MSPIGRWVRIASAVCLVGLVSPTPAFAQGTAIVVDRVGSVIVDGAQPATPVATLSRWSPGTRFRLANAASVRLLFIDTGDEFSVSGPGIALVGSSVATADEGAIVQKRTAPVGTRLRVPTGSLAMGGVVMRGAAVRASSPRGLLTRMPARLSWDDLVVDATYIVRIRSEEGSTLFEQRVQGTTLPFPDLKLAAETPYVWSVTAEPTAGRTPATASASFQLAAPSLRAEAVLLEARASASFADRIEFALWLERIGASGEAAQVWQRLADERPDDEAIYARAHR